MKNTIIAPGPLYTFLSYCQDSPLDKEVLDCGAGGAEPPLALFFEHGYQTHGIEISEEQLNSAQQFCSKHGMELGISAGDMRELPFADESMSFVYSYASICHMSKDHVAIAMQEITRVLKTDGLCLVSFCAAEDERWADGEPRGPGEYAYQDQGQTGIHSLFDDNEADAYFRSFTCLRKEKRHIKCFGEQGQKDWTEIYYIAKKR
jgi:SAM-dependent methyltransferase